MGDTFRVLELSTSGAGDLLNGGSIDWGCRWVPYHNAS